MFYLCYLYLFKLDTGVQHDIHTTWSSCRFTITNTTVPLVNQELLTIQEHLSSPSIVVGSCCTMLNLLCILLGSLLIPFPLVVVMSVIRYAASDCLWELHTFLIAEFEVKDRACSVSVFFLNMKPFHNII